MSEATAAFEAELEHEISIVESEDVEMTDDQILKHTQNIRKRLVNDITKGGLEMPTDKDDRQTLLTTLQNMDQQALSNKRIGVASDAVDADKAAAEALKVISKNFGNLDPFQHGGDRVINHTPDTSLLPEVEMVPGEGDIGICSETHEEFMRKMEGDD